MNIYINALLLSFLLPATVAFQNVRSFVRSASLLAPKDAVFDPVPRQRTKLFGGDDDDGDGDDDYRDYDDVVAKLLSDIKKIEKGGIEELAKSISKERTAVSRKAVTMETEDSCNDPKRIEEFYHNHSAKSRISVGDLIDSATIVVSVLNFLKQAYKSVKIDPEAKMGYAVYPNHPHEPDVVLSGLMKMLDGPPNSKHIFSLRKFSRLIERVLVFQSGLKSRSEDIESASAEDRYSACYAPYTDIVPKNKNLMENWEKDKEFARQYLAGVNPVMINVCRDLSQLSTQIVSHFVNDNLQDLIAEKRLFFVSYDDLEPFVSPSGSSSNSHPNYGRQVHAPIVLFSLDESRSELDVMGIQLDRTDDAKIYTKDDSYEEWLFAKIKTAAADSNIHEWISHLGKTHLAMEPHIIATHNTLGLKKHPLFHFFEPLFKDTLFLNYAARQTLSGYPNESWINWIRRMIQRWIYKKEDKGAMGDTISSIGIAHYLQINLKWWKTYDFFKSSGLPTELESRGFDDDFDMPCYLFRKDGLRLWEAYGEFASDFVDEIDIYDTDEDVGKDKVLQEWAEETVASDRADVPGFPAAINDKATLVKIMQTIMWTTSGQHAAVNSPQYDYYGFIPNKPMHLLLHESSSKISREGMFKILPEVAAMKDTLTIAHALTMPSENCIDNLEKQFAVVGKEAYKKFKKKLDVISDDIEDRNKACKKAGKPTYSYLNPAVVAASIDI